jgi:hypothetical protein
VPKYPAALSKVPTSVQANLNLKYHHKQKLDNERSRYDALAVENRNLVGRIKELGIQCKLLYQTYP